MAPEAGAQPSPARLRWPSQPGKAGKMLETLRERLLSVQQDLTAGWVSPTAPRSWRGERERGPRPAARPGQGGKQVTGGRGGGDWHGEGGRGGDCADGSRSRGWSGTRGALLSAGTGWECGSRVPIPPVFWADGGPASPALPRRLWGAGGGAAVPGKQLRSGEGERGERERERDGQTAVVREDVNGVN